MPTLRVWSRRLRTETHALHLAARGPRVRWPAKLLAGAVVAYALSPIDLIPDFIPVLGVLDDLIIVPLGLAVALRLIPADVMAECRARAAKTSERPVRRVASAIIIGVWILLAALSAALILRACESMDAARS